MYIESVFSICHQSLISPMNQTDRPANEMLGMVGAMKGFVLTLEDIHPDYRIENQMDFGNHTLGR